YRNRVASRSAGDLDAALARRLEIEIVNADAPLVQQLQLARGAQHVAAHRNLAGDGVVGVGDQGLHGVVAGYGPTTETHFGRHQRANLLGACRGHHIKDNDLFAHVPFLTGEARKANQPVSPSNASILIGKRRTRIPVACQTALAMAPALPVMPISPTPLTPSALTCGSCSSTVMTSSGGTSAFTGMWYSARLAL